MLSKKRILLSLLGIFVILDTSVWLFGTSQKDDLEEKYTNENKKIILKLIELERKMLSKDEKLTEQEEQDGEGSEDLEVDEDDENDLKDDLQIEDEIYSKDIFFYKGTTKEFQSHISEILNKIKRRKGSDLLPKCHIQQDSFVYIKNHKCASDTMSAVFRRFALAYDLSIVQPRDMKYNIGWPWKLKPYMYRASKSGRFNILTDHTVYNETYMNSIMYPGSVYITSIREPFSHLKSAFNFFNFKKLSHMIDHMPQDADFLMEFLKNKDHYDKIYQMKNTSGSRPCVPPDLSITKDMMSFDLGLPVGYAQPSQQKNLTYIIEWLGHLDGKFDVVMLMEYFHESLVMLKRMMCWTAKDVIYLRLNTRKRRDPPKDYPQTLTEDYLRWTLPDTLLYTHFNRTFWDRVEAMGATDFMAEVKDFENILNKTLSFCEGVADGVSQSSIRLTFQGTKWNPPFVVTKYDCLIIYSKTGARQELRDRYDKDPREVNQPQIPEGLKIGC